MEISRRHVSPFVFGPTREGAGTAYYYARTINGTPYRFTFVIMPNGERRHAVSKYNGYCRDLIDQGLTTLENTLKFGCAWTPVHFITVPA